jgi:hypothetical protein
MANVTENILKSIGKLICINLTQSVLNVRINHKFKEF